MFFLEGPYKRRGRYSKALAPSDYSTGFNYRPPRPHTRSIHRDSRADSDQRRKLTSRPCRVSRRARKPNQTESKSKSQSNQNHNQVKITIKSNIQGQTLHTLLFDAHSRLVSKKTILLDKGINLTQKIRDGHGRFFVRGAASSGRGVALEGILAKARGRATLGRNGGFFDDGKAVGFGRDTHGLQPAIDRLGSDGLGKTDVQFIGAVGLGTRLHPNALRVEAVQRREDMSNTVQTIVMSPGGTLEFLNGRGRQGGWLRGGDRAKLGCGRVREAEGQTNSRTKSRPCNRRREGFGLDSGLGKLSDMGGDLGRVLLRLREAPKGERVSMLVAWSESREVG
ncbi:uncharacterized protein BJ171DRAFT_503856 [Polychytrium aggregatum]|uniref:uncharacterized protein n=1 Tax=Polychytrium aggregatum TaxID=110093 RepID=UPI0022FEEC97|nr:uncharacterized protein BJ171DRAFT_503856 [Polychytrium aggregatum]KAI9204861.1 hypothetical protein BJ171DRAFT_503856 [Polychytrium aggregatum]